ncbi:hypothetical protein J4E83_007221 [Alternaria metachromatica]|uniref:uncharacterized protein n=1 Tax=Alternaria metachromatica TaxID=283354 RepID=UPI0020C20C12|nr:uncharacterized protein J4E83_007221 [Alternaria metachromatica]KAI4614567.1 hypothetical protein J4E83_007221 [Alternaria metachromatica]
MATVSLLRLPKELRIEIYEHYFSLKHGYWLDNATNKFTSIDGTRIELDLRFVNRQIAAETCGLAFQYNEAHVETCWEPSMNERLGSFEYYTKELHRKRSKGLLELVQNAETLLDPEVLAKVKEHYAQFLPDVQSFESSNYVAGDGRNWKKTPSTIRQFVKSELKYIVDATPSVDSYFKRLANLLPDSEPWCIPTLEDVRKMLVFMPAGVPRPPNALMLGRALSDETEAFWSGEKQRSSAASLAIHFLSHVSREARLEMRKVVLHEDRKSVAWPESHARGLVQFCQENKKLRIERRVDLWRNAFPAGSSPLVTDWPGGGGGLPSLWISKSLVDWIMEAVILPSLGMPENAFKLVLTDTPCEIDNSAIFDVVIADAATQVAFVRATSLPDSIAHPSSGTRTLFDAQRWIDIRRESAFVMEGFPEAIDAILKATSFVMCDFPMKTLDEPVDLEQISEHMKIDEPSQAWRWGEAWRERHDLDWFDPPPPLPAWSELRNEDRVDSLSGHPSSRSGERRRKSEHGHHGESKTRLNRARP